VTTRAEEVERGLHFICYPVQHGALGWAGLQDPELVGPAEKIKSHQPELPASDECNFAGNQVWLLRWTVTLKIRVPDRWPLLLLLLFLLFTFTLLYAFECTTARRMTPRPSFAQATAAHLDLQVAPHL